MRRLLRQAVRLVRWLPLVQPGGFVARHDALPVGDTRDGVGRVAFYRNPVRQDRSVRVVETEWSLAALEKL